MDRRLVLGFLSVILLSLASAGVFADSGVLGIDSATIVCGMNSSSLMCGNDVVTSCQVLLYGDVVNTVSRVVFTINGEDYQDSAVDSGNSTNSTWSYTKTVGAADATTSLLSLDKVTTYFQDGSKCVGTPSTGISSNCYTQFTTYSAPINCSCSYTYVNGSVDAWNTMVVTGTPNSACPDQRTVSFNVPGTDYCDPHWTATYSACSGVFDNPSTGVTGTTTKTYEAGDFGACCSLTKDTIGHTFFNHNGGSDCDPPPDEGTFSCRMDSWAQYQDNVFASGGDGRNAGFTTSSFTTNTVASDTQVQPIVFDFQRDGFSEVLQFNPTSKSIELLTKSLASLTSLTFPNAVTFSQPAMAGFTDYGGASSDPRTYNMEQFLLDGNSLVVVPFVTNSTNYVYVLNVSSSISVLYVKTYSNALSGANCLGQYCYFAELNGTGHKLDVLSGVDVSYSIAQIYSGGWSALDPSFLVFSSSMVPTFVSRLGTQITGMSTVFNALVPDGVQWWWYDNNPTQAAYFLDTDLDLQPYGVVSVASTVSGGNVSVSGNPTHVGAVSYATVVSFSNSTSRYDVFGWYDNNNVFKTLSSLKNLWVGATNSTNGQCLSNPVMLDKCSSSTEGYGIGVQYNVFSPSIGGSVTSSLSPSLTRQLTVSNTPPNYMAQVSGDGALVDVTYGYNTINSKFYYNGGFVADVQIFYNNGWPFAFGLPSVFFDERYKKIYYSQQQRQGSFPYYYYYTLMAVVDYSNPASIHVEYSVPLTQGTYAVGYPVIVGDYVVYPSDSTSRQLAFYRPNPNSTNNRWVNTTIAANVAYDSNSGMLMTTAGYISGFSSYICSSSTCARPPITNSVNGISGVYNQQSSAMKFILDEVNARKMTVTNGVESLTTLSCTNFLPLYYNSDSHILGVDRTTGELEYCDFSNELNPRIVKYGVAASTSISSRYSPPYGDVGYLSYMVNATFAKVYSYSAVLSSPTTSQVAYGRAVCLSPNIDNSARWSSVVTVGRECKSEVVSQGGVYGMIGLSQTTTVCKDVNQTVNWVTKSPVSVLSSAPIPYSSNCGLITKGDTDGTGSEDIFSSAGIASPRSGTMKFTLTGSNIASSHDWLLPVDMDSNGRIDLLQVDSSSSLLKELMGASVIEPLGVGNATIKNLRCTVTPGTGFTQYQVVAQLPDPWYAQVQIDPGDGYGSFVPDLAFDGIYTYQYGNSGTYTARVKLVQTSDQRQLATATCTVNVNYTSQQGLECSLGSAGEFDFVDSILKHGWVGDDLTPSYSMVQMQNSLVFHDLTGCSANAVTVTEGIVPVSSSGLQLYFDDTSAFTVTFGSGFIYMNTVNGSMAVWPYTADGQKHVLSVQLNKLLSTAYVYYDGSLFYSMPYTGSLNGVGLFGYGKVDYVRLTSGGGSTSSANSTLGPGSLKGDITPLGSCDRMEYDETVAGTMTSQEYTAMRMSYPHVLQYCSSTGSGKTKTYCTYGELQSIMLTNTACAKEIYNYCVKEEYPRAQGIRVLADADVMSAGTTCSAVLAMGAGFGGVAKPVTGIVWSVFTANWTYALVIIFVVVVVIAAKQRGSR